MRFVQVLACCAVLVLYLHEATALKCRTGETQANDQFQRVMHRCRDRVLQGNRKMGEGNSSDDNSDDDDDDDEDNYDDDDSSESDEKSYDKKFGNGRTGTTATSTMRHSGSNNNGGQTSNSRRYEQTSSTRPYPYNRIMNNGSSGVGETTKTLSRNNTTLRNGGSYGMANSGQNEMQNNERDQACVIQCFFDELNLIDQNGFPEKSAVTRIMMQSIQDRELQNFVEEAVMDCFYMIDADKNKEQCRFSQNLLTCLAGKGRERCEDWD